MPPEGSTVWNATVPSVGLGTVFAEWIAWARCRWCACATSSPGAEPQRGESTRTPACAALNRAIGRSGRATRGGGRVRARARRARRRRRRSMISRVERCQDAVGKVRSTPARIAQSAAAGKAVAAALPPFAPARSCTAQQLRKTLNGDVGIVARSRARRPPMPTTRKRTSNWSGYDGRLVPYNKGMDPRARLARPSPQPRLGVFGDWCCAGGARHYVLQRNFSTPRSPRAARAWWWSARRCLSRAVSNAGAPPLQRAGRGLRRSV